MFILKDYQARVLSQPNLNNEEFLAFQIWQIENLFKNEICAIKNIDLEYVAISDEYINTFKLNPSEILVNNNNVLFNMQKVFSEKIKILEQGIVDNQESQDSLFIFHSSKISRPSHYLMRKRPIINPSTQEVIGIFLVGTKYSLGFFRQQYIKLLMGWSKADFSVTESFLTDQQQQIIFCLLLGYHSRKEIATILSEITNEKFDQTRIKNILKALYEKFECRTPEQLIQSIVKNQINLELPVNTMFEGDYQI